ncbi:hypothetical protein PTKIN_Ptkin13bG0287400 [Pterospermum kingtungense]
MEGSSSKRMLVSLMVVVLMVVLAQGALQIEDRIRVNCAIKCFRKCPNSMKCFSFCLDQNCGIVPQDTCTNRCINSMVNAYKLTDAEKVESFVGSCYENCKNNNNN